MGGEKKWTLDSEQTGEIRIQQVPHRHRPTVAVGQEPGGTLLLPVLEDEAIGAGCRGVLHPHEMLVVPGFNVVIIKLVEYDVAEVVVARGTGPVAVAGKISGKKGLKKKKKVKEGFRLPGWRVGGWAGGYLLED